MEDVTLSVSEFIALCNQTLEYAYPVVKIEGEVSEFRISKSKWLYFKLKDQDSSLQFFGSVYNLQHPIEDGMLVVVNGYPKLHNKYGFSVNVRTITPSGEGNIKRAFEMLRAKLDGEGLFAPDRKRQIPTFPVRIGLIASDQSAAYADFMKILNKRWGGVEVLLANVQVQGDPASPQIVQAITHFNQLADPVDVLVITRGGGSAEDLQAFSSEEVARAVAGSRTPVVVGVGHETDTSLADLAADVRAATPSNAAQIVVPDREELLQAIDVAGLRVQQHMAQVSERTSAYVRDAVSKLEYAAYKPKERIALTEQTIQRHFEDQLRRTAQDISAHTQALAMVDPNRVLKRGYSLVKNANGGVVTDAAQTKAGQKLVVKLFKGQIETEVTDVKKR